MSREVNAVFIDSFDAEVHKAYQGQKMLRDTVRLKTGITGKSHRFPKSGKGVATRHIPGNDVIAMNLSYDKVTANLEDWNADDYSDIFDIEKINFSEQQELAFNTASAMGRREDQLIIDAMSLASNTTGGSSTEFNVALLRSLGKTLDENNVPSEDRFIAWSPQHKSTLLGVTEATSSDFNSVNALNQGTINSFYGFTFKLIGNREEGGLGIATVGTPNTYYFYAYHKKAVGLAIGKDMTSHVDWIAEKKAWLIGCDYSAGSIIIDNEAVIKGEAK